MTVSRSMLVVALLVLGDGAAQCAYQLESRTTVTVPSNVSDLTEWALESNLSGTMLLVSQHYGDLAELVSVSNSETTSLPDVSKRSGVNGPGVTWRWWGDDVVADREGAWSSATIVFRSMTLEEEESSSVLALAVNNGRRRAQYVWSYGSGSNETRIVRQGDRTVIVDSNAGCGRPVGVRGETREGDCLIEMGGGRQAMWTSSTASLRLLPVITEQSGGFRAIHKNVVFGIRDTLASGGASQDVEDAVVDNALVVFDRRTETMSDIPLGIAGNIRLLNSTDSGVLVIGVESQKEILVLKVRECQSP